MNEEKVAELAASYFEDEIPREYPIQLMEILNKRLKPHNGKLIIIATPNSYYEKKEVNNNLDANSIGETDEL